MINSIDIKKITWLLFEDINTRVNLISDEFLHLQQTIKVVAVDVSGKDAIRDLKYYIKSPKERALDQLFWTIDAFRLSLSGNQNTIKSAYEATLTSNINEALYWFITLRGQFVNNVLDYYLQHIQHSHQKLIQYLENMPGALPSPMLYRRWSNAGYGEFLSEYSRKANFSIQDAVWNFVHSKNQGIKSDDFEKWRNESYLTHTWAHQSTSTVRTLEAVDGGNQKKSFVTIWSSYFYLEQPILLPLLYHECAHHIIGSKIQKFEDKDSFNYNLLVKRREEAFININRLIEFEGGDNNFWDIFTQEVWADAISIITCGQGFLSALVLQWVGLQDGNLSAYSNHDLAKDTLIPINDIGKPDRRTWHVPYPEFSLTYFWEARILLAIKVFKKSCHSSDLDWITALESFIDAWFESGKLVFSKSQVSQQHETLWQHRKNLNFWIVDVAWSHMQDFITQITRSQEHKKSIKPYLIPSQLQNIIFKTYENYTAKIFTSEKSNKPLTPINTIDDICITIRWGLSSYVIKELEILNNRNLIGNYDKWTSVFANYMRSDGSAAYRLAMEWMAVNRDLYILLGFVYNKIENNIAINDLINGIPCRDVAFVRNTYNHCLKLSENKHAHQDNIKNIIDFLVKAHAIHPNHLNSLNSLNENFTKFKNELLDALSTSISRNYLSGGTFTLGVIRPDSIESFSEGHLNVNNFLDDSLNNKKNTITKNFESINGSTINLKYYSLMGEYSFAAYEPFFTPAEKDYPSELASSTKILLKPRSVIKLKGNEKNSFNNAFVKISQISFKFKWQWLNLYNLLKNQNDFDFDFFLSSGWEDVILITYYRSNEDYSKFSEKYELNFKDWQDIHSNLGILGKSCNIATTSKPNPTQSKNIEETLIDTGLFSSVFRRTGRYDITVQWICTSVSGFLHCLNLIPKSLLNKFSNISTSGRLADNGKYWCFTSQIILNHE